MHLKVHGIESMNCLRLRTMQVVERKGAFHEVTEGVVGFIDQNLEV